MYKEQDEMIWDRIISGIKNQAARETLLAKGDSLTLKNAVARWRTHELTQAQLK